MGKKFFVVSLLVLFFCHLLVGVLYADDAEVLPKGVSRVGIKSKLFFPYDKRFDPDGDKEDVAEDYNKNLNSSVFPALSLVEIAFGMPPGSATLGNSIVSIDYEYYEFKLYYQYGITDRLTAGINIPYQFREADVGARLDITNATVGKSAIGVGFGAPLVPLAGGGPFGDAVPLTTQDIQLLIGPGLDINGDGTIDVAGYGYEAVENWSDNGIGDIEVGFRYQYFKTKNWRLAFTGGVRLPTGEVDDPDNLVDRPFGTGAWALLFQFQNDYIVTKNLVLNGTLRYDLYLPDKQRLRVPDDVNQPITHNKENVDRNLGDLIEFELEGTYQFLEGFNFSLLYEFSYWMQDRVSGDRGFNYESLEDETRRRSHIAKISLSYSTIPLYKKKEFFLPLVASISYRNRFAGKNVFKTQYIGVDLGVFF